MEGGSSVLCDDTSALPQRLRQLRHELGWSQDDVANAVQAAGKGVVTNWETMSERRRTPPLGTLMALARWYGVSLDYLVGIPGAERDSPMVRHGKTVLRDRLPAEIRQGKIQTPGERFRLAVSILQQAAPDAFFTGRVAAALLQTEAGLLSFLQRGFAPDAVLRAFAEFAGVPAEWFYVDPNSI